MVFRNILFTIVIALTFVACGGGGGGGGGSSTSYTGSRDLAVIDTTNAKTLSLSGIGGYETGVAIAARGEEQNKPSNPALFDISKILANSVEDIELNNSSSVASGAIVNDSGTSGCISFNRSIDNVTGSFTGTFNFNNCTEGGTTISGSMNLSGTIDLSTGLPTQVTFSTNSITVTSGSEGFTMSGSISMSVGTSSFSMLMEVLFQDNATGEVVWINNFSITASENLSSIDITISGRIYLPDHGYVDFVTDQPIRVNDADINASSGQMTITGANNSSARLTVISNTQYTLEVDEDGDSIYDPATFENW